MHYGTSSFTTFITMSPVTESGCIDMPHLAHSHILRGHIDSAPVPGLWENALNAQQGIIVIGATFQQGWGPQNVALQAPTGVRKEQTTHYNVSASLVPHAADQHALNGA